MLLLRSAYESPSLAQATVIGLDVSEEIHENAGQHHASMVARDCRFDRGGKRAAGSVSASDDALWCAERVGGGEEVDERCRSRGGEKQLEHGHRYRRQHWSHRLVPPDGEYPVRVNCGWRR